MALQRMTEGKLWMNPVPVAAAITFSLEIPVSDQLRQDALGGTLGDSDLVGDVAHEHARIPSHADDDMGVIGQKGPVGHVSG